MEAAVVGGSSSGINATKQLKSGPLKTKPHTKMPNSCKPASFKKIRNESYMSGDLRDKRTLIAGEDGDSSIIGFARKSTRVSIRDFHLWLWIRPINNFRTHQ